MGSMPEHVELDALVVGTGFGGIYQLYSLLKLGLNCRAIDSAGDVGGTWYWNRYPGAMSDSYSHIYRYSWDKEDLETYPWPRNYVVRDEILQYLNHVVDKHGLRAHMQFSTEMVGARWDEASRRWHVKCSSTTTTTTTTTTTFSARYLITALGLLHRKKDPGIPGALDGTFAGRVVHSTEWDAALDEQVRGRRVGLVGCGSTGIQITVALADKVRELRAFIRHPQYTVPAGLREVTPQERERVNAAYDDIWRRARGTSTAFGIEESQRKTMSVPPEERQAIYERLWDHGNAFHFMFSGFGDVTTDAAANAEMRRFLRAKIADIVRDPAKAAVLTPSPDEPYARRPPCDRGYYDAFNRDNVVPVDVARHPIVGVERGGVRTADGVLHELDVLVLATGFDAVDGTYAAIPEGVRGRGGRRLAEEHWGGGGPTAYMGVFVSGFPNLFLVNGPQGAFCNQPTAIEVEVDMITDLIRRQRERDGAGETDGAGDGGTIEVAPETEAEWASMCDSLATQTLFDKVANNWLTGQNFAGAKPTTRFYYGGLKAYIDHQEDLKKRNYEGLVFS